MRLSSFIVILLFLSLLGFIVVERAISAKKSEVCLVDLKTIKAQFIRQLAEKKVSDKKVVLASLQFKEKLKQTLANFSKRYDVVILEQQSVLSGGRDVTDAIAKDLSFAMRNKS